MRLSVIAATVAALFAGNAIAADLYVELGPNKLPINSSKLKRRMEVAFTEGTWEADLRKMYLDYQENEVSADSKYKGKWLTVKGKVGEVAKDFGDKVYLTFPMDQYGIQHVRAVLFSEQVCSLSKEGGVGACPVTDKAGKLKRGQAVTLDCRGSGMVLKTPSLKDCLIFD